MAGKMSRNKGQRGEREVIKLLQPVVDRVYADRELSPPQLQRNLLQAHVGGHDVFGLMWLAPEVKFQEKPNVEMWWQQALRQAGDKVPVLIWRQTRRPWRVRMFGTVGRIGAVVDVDFGTFLEWFEDELCTALNDGIG